MLAATVSNAKQSPGADELDPFLDKVATSYFPEEVMAMPITEATVVAYLQNKLPHLQAQGVTLQLIAHKVSPGGEHFTFDQVYNGVPVFNSQVKVNLGTRGTVYSIFDNSYRTKDWLSSQLLNDAASLEGLQLAELLAQTTGYTQATIEEHSTIAEINGKAAAYKWMQLYDAASGDFRLYLLDKTGTIIYNHNLNSNSGVLASAYVFNPDPLTTALTVYGPPYVDSNDSNTVVLRAERKLVNIDVKFVGGIYSLENDHFIITDFSTPNQTVVTSNTPTFLFTRSDSGFEEVNAYYHLNVYQAYLSSLGYGTLSTDQIQVDAHALNGAENSQFSVGGGFPRLFFGDGGVDDAEDADVIIHEYGHALSYAGSPATNFGAERPALDEGFGDYFAASYSRSLSPFRWNFVFSWDGHNEYWNGRNAATEKVYPDDLRNSIHSNGEMWSTALMQVWSALGQEVADKLALETLFMLASNMTFTDAALAYIQADNALYGGDNYDVIFAIMVERGFLNGVGIQQLSNGKSVTFGLYNTNGFTFNGESAILVNYSNEVANLTIYDISGKVIRQTQTLTGSTHYINGEQFLPGSYILKVTAGNTTQTFKLIK